MSESKNVGPSTTDQPDLEALALRAAQSVKRCRERAGTYGDLRQSSLTAITLDHAADALEKLRTIIAGEAGRVEAAVAAERERCAEAAEGRDDDQNDADDDMKTDASGEIWHRESSYGTGRSDAAAAIRRPHP